MELNKKKTKILNSLCAFALALMMLLSSFGGLIEVKAESFAPTIDKVIYGATKISGGNVYVGEISGKTVRGTIHVTLKNSNKLKAELSVTPRSGSRWSVRLPKNVKVEFGDIVTVYQEFNGSNSETITVNAEPSMALDYKNDLRMPSGKIWIEQTSSNLVNDEEQAEAAQMLKDANTKITKYIQSVKFSIDGKDHAYYKVIYTDGSVSEEIEATNLAIQQVTETSAAPKIEKVQVTDKQIIVTLEKEVSAGTKFYFIERFTDNEDKTFCQNGNCNIVKSNIKEMSESIDIDGKKVTFPVNNEDTLKLEKEFGVIVKEPHKFRSCAKSKPVITSPAKIAVKNPKKLTEEEKKTIEQAIRDINKTSIGKSKLPDGTVDHEGIPAIIQIDDSGNVKIFNANNVEITYDSDYNVIPTKNEDGSYKLKEGSEPETIFDKPEELLSNLPPDTPKMENKEGNVVVTPNTEVDTDAKKVVVEYEGTDGSKKTITATKTDTGWTVDNHKAKVDENGIVSFPAKEVKSDTTVNAYVVDDGGLVPEETNLDSPKAELKIENKYKVTYDANGGEGTMPEEEEVSVGSKHRIKDNSFTAPAEKEFDHWMIGFEPKNSGEDVEVNNDIVIKAVWKYIINPSASEVETIIGHPVSYKMYRDAIKDFPAALTVEHIKVVTPPDISKVGGTQAEIEVRFSDGQFRRIQVTVNVKPDPKDATIEKLNKDIEGLNEQITEKDGKITELNDKITELENQLKDCQEQCAADKAACEAKKAELQKQINTLAKEKSNLEIQVKENRELIEQLRSQITDLKQQVEDWKKIAGDKDTKIKEHGNSIKELNTKLETANNANTELKEKLAAANQKITDLESKIKELEGKVTELEGKITELGNTIKTKDTEIKTLNDTITTLKEKIAKLETEKAKDKEAYEKDKADLEKQLQETKETLTAKETELGEIKTQLEKVKEDLATEKEKTSGLTEQVKAKNEKIAELENQIADLQKKVEEAGNNNTTVIEKYGKEITEKNTIIETLKSEKAELEKQLEVEKTKNENLEKQVADLTGKLDKATIDLNNANARINDLEKQLTAEQEKNKNLTEQLGKITADLENKTKEVETLNGTITNLKEQLAKITAEQAKDKEACEKAKAELQEKLDKANQDLADKSAELDKIKAELEQAKKDLADEKEKNAGLTEKTKAQEEKITGLEEKLKTLQDKLNKADTDLKDANDKIKELEKELAAKDADNKNLTAQVEKLGKDLETKTNEVNNLNTKIVELEKQVSEKTAQGETDKAEIERLKAELEDLKNKLQAKSDEADNLSKEIVTLKETVKTLEGEKTELTNNVARLEKEVTELKETIKTSKEKIIELEKENSALKEANKTLIEKVAELTEKVKKTEDENNSLKDKIEELNKQLSETNNSQCDVEELNRLKREKAALEATLKGKDELIQELRNQIAELKKSLTDKDTEYKEKIKELEEKINNLTTENTSCKGQLATVNQKITDLEALLQVEKDKNKQLEEENENNKKEIRELETSKKTLEEEKAKIEEKSKELENKVEAVEKEKEQLLKDKENLEAEVERLNKELSEKPDNCPTCDTKELEDKIAKLEKTIKNQKNDIAKKDKEIADLKEKLANSSTDTSKLDKQIADLNERIKELQGKLTDKEKELNNKANEFAKEKETWKKEKDNFIRDRWNNYNYWGDYRPNYNRERELEYDNDSLKHKNSDLARENKELKERNSKLESISNREEYVTIFYLDETLYKTFLGREFLTQAEMTDSKGYIKPFVSNNRTMLPIRYLALSLGMDVKWDQKTRTATFSNYKNNNVLNRGSVTINADTLEMKDQNGRIIYVDAKPVLINGRFYVSITNVTKAFGGSNGNINDGIKNTIEWDAINREVLVYKNIR